MDVTERIIQELKKDVDRTLIVANLRKPPEGRLHTLSQMQRLVAEMRASAPQTSKR